MTKINYILNIDHNGGVDYNDKIYYDGYIGGKYNDDNYHNDMIRIHNFQYKDFLKIERYEGCFDLINIDNISHISKKGENGGFIHFKDNGFYICHTEELLIQIKTQVEYALRDKKISELIKDL